MTMVTRPDPLAELLADPGTVTLSLGEGKAKYGQVIAHAKAGGTVVLRNAKTGCIDAIVSPPPGGLDTTWAGS